MNKDITSAAKKKKKNHGSHKSKNDAKLRKFIIKPKSQLQSRGTKQQQIQHTEIFVVSNGYILKGFWLKTGLNASDSYGNY